MTKRKRRVCLLYEPSSEPTDIRIFSSVKKAFEELETAVRYRALITRLNRAEQKTGIRKSQIEAQGGKLYIIEVKQIH